MENAKIFTLNQKDFVRGLFVTVVTAFLTGIITVLEVGGIPTLEQLRFTALAALSAGISYLGKNLVTNSNDELFKAEPKNNV